ncbi:MAG: FAD-dependent oxidoreductase [Desulfobacterales bacterium]|nr:FAD-dependent oxidoreductase [Desulfobacterales bacterium]
MTDETVLILGAGPAGLSAAYECINRDVRPIVLDKENTVGGMARTNNCKGYYFDIGGHRFFTKNQRIGRLWQDMLGDDFLKVDRMSRIYHQGRFFNYPLDFINTLSNLGIAESLLIVLSYCKAQLLPYPQERSFEEWVINRFGSRLYRTFLKTYTEKVWGIPCHKIQSGWAEQRIKGLSLMSAVSNALIGTQKARSLINEFHYPLKGPGMMWQRFQQAILAGGGRVELNSKAVGLNHKNGRITGVTYIHNEKTVEVPVGHLISSIPITRLVSLLEPKTPDEIYKAAHRLSYRAFIIVGLVVDKKDLFPDQWLYIHSPNVQVGRIQNFKNWSSAMVPDPRKTSVGMEYFCTEGDEIWTMPDSDLTEMASRELSELGLAHMDDIQDSFVMRQPNAYPIYDHSYQKQLDIIRDFLGTIDNLQTIGRNGMHRYNNMDHSMLTGVLAVENIFGENHDLWDLNVDRGYLEEDDKTADRKLIPEKILTQTFARMDKLAFATAVGSVLGLIFFIATIWPVIIEGDMVDPRLILLAQYFIGYTVTIKGAFVASAYSFGWGFLLGWLFAYLRNLFIGLYIFRAKKKAELLSLRDFFDHL